MCYRSTEDLSPSYVDRSSGTTFYDRATRVSAAIATGSGSGSGAVVDSSEIPPQTQYIRRPSSNSYHTGIPGGGLVNNGSGGSSGGAGATIAGGLGGASGAAAAIGVGVVGDVRGRTRDRLYRNGPFTPAIERCV